MFKFAAVKQRQVMWDQLVQLIIAAISVISILSGVYYCVKHSQKKSSDPGIQSDPEEDRTFPVGATGLFVLCFYNDDYSDF